MIDADGLSISRGFLAKICNTKKKYVGGNIFHLAVLHFWFSVLVLDFILYILNFGFCVLVFGLNWFSFWFGVLALGFFGFWVWLLVFVLSFCFLFFVCFRFLFWVFNQTLRIPVVLLLRPSPSSFVRQNPPHRHTTCGRVFFSVRSGAVSQETRSAVQAAEGRQPSAGARS
jgi:hypothetical protein